MKNYFVRDDRAVVFQMIEDVAKWKYGIKGAYYSYTIASKKGEMWGLKKW